jgi:hypothetical protein
MTSVSVTWGGEAAEVVDGEQGRRLRLPASTGLALAVALALLGFALIGVTWWQVSDLTNIAQQLPYFVSGGLTGIGLVVLSAATLVVVTRRGDDARREAQAEALVEALRALADKDGGQP